MNAAHTAQPIKIAILAMGGEGGGVLADWLVSLAEHNDWIAQTTSVPGVAQRTGATIYYVELFPAAAAREAGAAPVLALMPLPGDVDVVLASELMEAARAVQRGLVSSERTTLVASTHRVYAIAEKVAMGDGRADAAALLTSAQQAARRFIGFDMAATAEAHASVISAVLLGALAASGALPFKREQFEETVRQGGVGVKASLLAFDAAFTAAQRELQAAPAGTAATFAHIAASPAANPAGATSATTASTSGSPASAPFSLPRSPDPAVQSLIEQAAAQHSGAALPLVIEGLRRLVDYQDTDYAALYLQRLGGFAMPAHNPLQADLARHLALWMSYEDTIRVADLKTRGSRFQRVRGEVRSGGAQVLAIHEYLHPRLQEVAETLPAPLGRWLLATRWPRALVSRFTQDGRTVHTNSLRGFVLLRGVAALRRWRRGTLRYAMENQRIERWLVDVQEACTQDAGIALELVRNQRLVKGYGDTHERGLRSYDALRQAWRAGASAAQLARLREAALADEHGHALQRELLAQAQARGSASSPASILTTSGGPA